MRNPLQEILTSQPKPAAAAPKWCDEEPEYLLGLSSNHLPRIGIWKRSAGHGRLESPSRQISDISFAHEIF